MTGIGLVSPVGIGTQANWDALCSGMSGIGPITRFDASAFATRFAGEVKGFDPLQFIEKKELKKMDIFIQFAVAASQFAMDDAKLDDDAGDGAARRRVHRVGHRRVHDDRARAQRPTSTAARARSRRSSSPRPSSTWPSGQVSIRFGAKGPNLATCTACTASAHAVGDSFEIIRRGAADAMIAGGAEAAVCAMGVGGFGALRALSTRNDDPAHASRPFDRDRDGFVLGEGAGMLILEELEFAQPPRRDDLRRDGRLRHVGRRVSHDRAVRRRRRRVSGDAGGARVGGHRAGRRRLHQRARHLDAAQRSHRDRGDQADVWRSRAQAGGVVDQVDDRPPARRGRRARGRHHRAGGAPSESAADDQSRQPGRGARPRLRPEHSAATCRFATRCRIRSALAAPTARCCSRSSKTEVAAVAEPS